MDEVRVFEVRNVRVMRLKEREGVNIGRVLGLLNRGEGRGL